MNIIIPFASGVKRLAKILIEDGIMPPKMFMAHFAKTVQCTAAPGSTDSPTNFPMG